MLKVARLQDRIPAVAELHRLYYARGALGVLPMRMGGATSLGFEHWVVILFD